MDKQVNGVCQKAGLGDISVGRQEEHVQRYRGMRAGCSRGAMGQFTVTGVWDPRGEAEAVLRVCISAVVGGQDPSN